MLELVSDELKLTIHDATLGLPRENFMEEMEVVTGLLWDVLHPKELKARLEKSKEVING